jgi:hypothetical protein
LTSRSKSFWIGWVLSVLPVPLFLFSALMKIKGGPEMDQGFAHLGLPLTMARPLAILELSCVAIYLIPQTAVLGAILLAGYLGGATLTHLRVGDPVFMPIGIGLVLWLGLWLRESRLKALLPFRS